MSNSQNTFSAKAENVERQWYVVDATDKTLGRLATKVATYLRGKHKSIYTSHVDTGDYVIIINAEKIRVTGNKPKEKKYYRHSGYPGGFKEETFEKMRNRKPEGVLELAIQGMLPKTSLGRAMLRKLWIYAGDKHPHQAQQPQSLE